MFDDEDTENAVVRFSFTDVICGNQRDINFTITRNSEYYPELLAQFKYFLQAMGFNYIGSIAAFDENGKPLKTSEDL